MRNSDWMVSIKIVGCCSSNTYMLYVCMHAYTHKYIYCMLYVDELLFTDDYEQQGLDQVLVNSEKTYNINAFLL